MKKAISSMCAALLILTSWPPASVQAATADSTEKYCQVDFKDGQTKKTLFYQTSQKQEDSLKDPKHSVLLFEFKEGKRAVTHYFLHKGDKPYVEKGVGDSRPQIPAAVSAGKTKAEIVLGKKNAESPGGKKYGEYDRMRVKIQGTTGAYFCESWECDPADPKSNFNKGQKIKVYSDLRYPENNQGIWNAAKNTWTNLKERVRDGDGVDPSPYLSIYEIQKDKKSSNLVVARADKQDQVYAQILDMRGVPLTGECPVPRGGTRNRKPGRGRPGGGKPGHHKPGDGQAGNPGNSTDTTGPAGADIDTSALSKAIQDKYGEDPMLQLLIEGVIVESDSENCKNVQGCVDQFNKDPEGWQKKATGKLRGLFAYDQDTQTQHYKVTTDIFEKGLLGWLKKKKVEEKDLQDYDQCLSAIRESEPRLIDVPEDARQKIPDCSKVASCGTLSAIESAMSASPTSAAGNAAFDGQVSHYYSHCNDVMNRLRIRSRIASISKDGTQTGSHLEGSTPPTPGTKPEENNCLKGKKENCGDDDHDSTHNFLKIKDMFNVGLWGATTGGLISATFFAFGLGFAPALGLGLIVGGLFALWSFNSDSSTERFNDVSNDRGFTTKAGGTPAPAPAQ